MQAKRKLIPLSKITPRKESMDSVKAQLSMTVGGKRPDIILQAQSCWDNLYKYRKNRARNKRYTYGDQLSDTIYYNGETITEENYLISQGNTPLKNNLIRRLVRTVMGVYRGQDKEPTCIANDRDEQKLGETMTIALQVNARLNKLNEINGRLFEEFLISGSAFSKETYGWRRDKLDCWTDIVSPNHIFFDGAFNDIRHWDLTMIGELHDISFDSLCTTFAHTPQQYKELSEIYHLAKNRSLIRSYMQDFGKSELRNIDFLVPYNQSLCRVIEVWTVEHKPRYRCHDFLNGDVYKVEESDINGIVAENQERLQQGAAEGIPQEEIPLIEYEWFMDSYWYYRFLTPFGHVLDEGETPYAHKSHPYTIKLYPFIDGEIHGFVEDVIDQQRYVNRLITINDFAIRSSAKGVLLFPESLLPDDMDMDDIAEQWTKSDGLIAYKPKPGVEAPKQIVNNLTNIGTHEMLQLMMNLMEDTSGVTGALQGKPGFSGTSGALYAQQQQNASTSLLDLLETFSSFIIDSATKKVKNIQQFYTSKRILNIVGKSASEVTEYDPQKIGDVEFDLSIVESVNTPVARMAANEILLELFRSQAIGVEQLLEFGNFAFSDGLLQSIKAQKEQIEEGKIPENVSPELMQQVQQGANPEQIAKYKQMVSGL